ncbi:MAG: HAMP domain-containing methyl-accepting chemotaxis protein [Bacillota bacterium]|nr:HAMP domain-containing methyl-accepting chemotaxis protein [Bacillota bacterium]
MTNLFKLSLAKKLILTVSSLLLVLIILFIITSYLENKNMMINEQKSKALKVIQTIDATLNSDITPQRFQDNLNRLKSIQKDIVQFDVYDINTGLEIASIDKKNIGKKADHEDIQAAKENKVVTIIDSDIVDVTAPFHVGGKTNYVAGVQFSISSELQIIKSNLIKLVVTGLGLIIIGILLTSIITRKMITLPILAVNQQLKEIAEGDGDLTHQIVSKSNDEIGELARSINKMSNNLRDIITQVKNHSEIVASSATQLTVGAEESNKASKQINGDIHEVAAGIEKQAARAVEVNHVVTEISHGMEQTASSIQMVADYTVSANDKAANGRKLVMQTMEQMNQVQLTVNQISNIILSLGDKIKEIDQIVSLITQVSSQTNLLALNAAIEAARAGEHGKGFAVVADEVRKLAEQSAEATENIRQLIGVIQLESDIAVSSMNQGTDVVKRGLDMVKQTGDSFYSIVKMIQDISGQSQEVAAIVEEVNASSLNMVQAIESISNISEQSSLNIQHVSETAGEQTIFMGEITDSAASLSKMADELQKVIGRFKV